MGPEGSTPEGEHSIPPPSWDGSTTQCARCGTLFEGRFCPACGAPATAAARPSAPPPAPGTTPAATGAPPAPVRCARCGTTYEGKYCPACGLPSWAAWVPPSSAPPAPSSYPLLSVVWLVSLLGFFIVLAAAVGGLAASIPEYARGIGSIERGVTTDPGFDGGAGSWSFVPSTPGASGAVNASGGDPGGFAYVQLDGAAAAPKGYWMQSFVANGTENYSSPYLGEIVLDYRVVQAASNLGNVTIAVFVDRNPAPPLLGEDVWNVTLTGTTNWTPAGAEDPTTGTTFIDATSATTTPGTYYLKIAAFAKNTGAPPSPVSSTIVGFDNARLRWLTYAYVDFFVIVPFPSEIYATQDPAQFTAWVVFLVAAAVTALVFVAARDAKRLWAAVRAPLDQLPAKLRSRSAFVALTQAFLAVIFVNVVAAIVAQPSEPSVFLQLPPWYYLYVLFNATVYEEIIFRVLIIGLPLLVGSLVSRIGDVLKGAVPAGKSRGRYLAGSFRYLLGGGMSRDTSLVVLLPASLLLIANAVVFGIAHAPGYGDWKVVPAAIAGLAMGYLFLRHGVAVSILFHFATNMSVAAITLAGDTSSAGTLLNLLLFVLALPGAGFFAYYIVYGFRLVQDVRRRASPPTPARAAVPTVSGVPGTGPAGPEYPPRTAPPGPATPPAPPGGISLPSDYMPAVRPPGYGLPPVQYRCPRCGWVEATYDAGRFRCARCGYLS